MRRLKERKETKHRMTEAQNSVSDFRTRKHYLLTWASLLAYSTDQKTLM